VSHLFQPNNEPRIRFEDLVSNIHPSQVRSSTCVLFQSVRTKKQEKLLFLEKNLFLECDGLETQTP